MDLIFRRVLPRSAMARPASGGFLPWPGKPEAEEPRAEFAVQIPNPTYPHDRSTPHRHHSTTDIRFEHCWGYGGSGPADLALNARAAFLPATGKSSDVALWDGSRVWVEAWRLHQSFKWVLISGMAEDGGRATAGEIHSWIAQQLPSVQPVGSDADWLFDGEGGGSG
jgi:hypothetical protein